MTRKELDKIIENAFKEGVSWKMQGDCSMEEAIKKVQGKIMKKEIKRAKDFLDYELQDDETEFGGISFAGETLKDFIEEVGLNKNTAMRYVNAALKQCGIKSIKY